MSKDIEDVRRWFAEEVYGYELFCGNLVDKENPITFGGDVNYPVIIESFMPDQNLEQTFEVLEEYCKKKDYKWTLHGRKELHLIAKVETKDVFYESDTIEKTILGCILKAESETKLLEVLENVN